MHLLPRFRPPTGLLPLAAFLYSIIGAQSAELALTFNPINQLARVIDNDLVKMEERVSWLDNRLNTLADYSGEDLRYGLGCRGGRFSPQDPDPTVVLDLGAEYPLDSLFLIPAQRDAANAPSLFPRKFTIELSNRADFGQRMILYTTGGEGYFSGTNSKLVKFAARGTSARYVRLTVQEGHTQGNGDLFSLSEIVVTANGQPVSFGAKVTGQGLLAMPGIWAPEYLTDGRSPLGFWQGGPTEKNNGDAVTVSQTSPKVSWRMDWGEELELDSVVLFPHMVSQAANSLVLPDRLKVELEGPDGVQLVVEWTNPIPGSIQSTPLVIPLHRRSGHSIKLTAITPWTMGDLSIQALSEIQVWSDGSNVIEKMPLIRNYDGIEATVTSLTDNIAAEKRIIPVATWLNQLIERLRLERELSDLRPIYHETEKESMINATWGSAVMLGLTFLIPVFIVERRRLINRRQLETLRKRIASDLHDDIGSNLGSISLIARTARKDLVRLHGPDEVAEDLSELEIIARESSLAMRDIVWLLEQRADSIGDLVQRMQDTANRLLRNVDYTLDFDSCKTATKLSLDAKRHLFLFYKETIHNIFKHSQATRVSLKLWDQADTLVMEVCDNGVGFETQSSTRATPVHKLEERARALAGQLDILSIPTKGTSIRLTVKRALLLASTPST